MKKTLLLMTIILCASATVLSQNLLTNGSFENFTANPDGTIPELANDLGTLNAWGANSAGRDAVRLSDQSPQHGAQSIYWRDGKRGPINQKVELTDGKYYRASVWVKWSAGAVNSGIPLLRVDNAVGEVARVDLNGMETDWTEYTVEFTASGTDCYILINRFGTTTGNVGEMYVDNVMLIEILPNFTLTVDNIFGEGSVTVDEDAYTVPLLFEAGTEVPLSAVAATDWEFVAWGGGLVSTQNPETITMNANKTISATYKQTQHLLTNGSFENFKTDGDGNIIFAPLGNYYAWAVPSWLPKNQILLSDQSPQHENKSIYWADSKDGPIKQRVALTDGKEYRASVRVKWSEGAENTGDTQFKVDANGAANTSGTHLVGVQLNGMQTAWTEYTFEFTASGTSHEIVVYRWGTTGNLPVGEMYVDNVVLTEVGIVSGFSGSVLGENLSFYPNPCKDILRINYAAGIKAASITNLAGQVIIKQEINSSNDQSIINTSSLEKGVYLLQVTGKEGETQTVKLIKH